MKEDLKELVSIETAKLVKEKGYTIQSAQWFIDNFDINKELRQWLLERWLSDNHKKYHKYFDEWVSNITMSQIEGFSKQMYNDKNNVLIR